ncbi:hypothetical protein B0H16DRAFT_1356322 [Mycena metata]|uniref:F-box domain-containing protein n=1 Tax=Mycena metata TaxID=1033252 RepID=A0AAD7KF86_9AGAR|nr:hypothetical protein B0H16DRAFT_1356322 [Mycena metata]
MSLQTAPPEILDRICRCLDASTILKLGQVSHQFRCIVQSSGLRYKVELELAGLRDGRLGNTSSAARLDMLKAYQAAWANFDWSQSTQTTVQFDGLYYEVAGNVVATYSFEAGFLFTRIPSLLRHIPHQQWSINHLFCAVNDFSLNLSLDLLVVVELESSKHIVVRFLSLQTGRPHPLAQQPHLSAELESPKSSPSYTFTIRIFGEYVGVMTEPEGGSFELHVWEWKTGILQKHLFDAEMTSFAFLDHQRLLVSGFTDLQPELRVLEINDSPANSFILVLPELVLDPADVKLHIRTEAPPSWPADARLPEPFSTSHDERLFVVEFGSWDSIRGAEPAYLLCVPLSAILNLIHNPVKGTSKHTLFWERWGPSSTRMLAVPKLPNSWACYVYGQRCVIQTDKTQWKTLDFNQFDLDPLARIQHETTVDKRHRMFVQSVVTSQPFTLQSISTPLSTYAVMLAEDAIVVVTKEENALSIFSI